MNFQKRSGLLSPTNDRFNKTQSFSSALDKSRNSEAEAGSSLNSTMRRPKKIMAIFNTQLNSRMRQGSQPRPRGQSPVKAFKTESKDGTGSEQLRTSMGAWVQSLPVAPRIQMTYKVVQKEEDQYNIQNLDQFKIDITNIGVDLNNIKERLVDKIKQDYFGQKMKNQFEVISLKIRIDNVFQEVDDSLTEDQMKGNMLLLRGEYPESIENCQFDGLEVSILQEQPINDQTQLPATGSDSTELMNKLRALEASIADDREVHNKQRIQAEEKRAMSQQKIQHDIKMLQDLQERIQMQEEGEIRNDKKFNEITEMMKKMEDAADTKMQAMNQQSLELKAQIESFLSQSAASRTLEEKQLMLDKKVSELEAKMNNTASTSAVSFGIGGQTQPSSQELKELESRVTKMYEELTKGLTRVALESKESIASAQRTIAQQVSKQVAGSVTQQLTVYLTKQMNKGMADQQAKNQKEAAKISGEVEDLLNRVNQVDLKIEDQSNQLKKINEDLEKRPIEEKEGIEPKIKQNLEETQEKLEKQLEEHQSKLEDMRKSLSSMVLSQEEKAAAEKSQNMAHTLAEEFQKLAKKIQGIELAQGIERHHSQGEDNHRGSETCAPEPAEDYPFARSSSLTFPDTGLQLTKASSLRPSGARPSFAAGSRPTSKSLMSTVADRPHLRSKSNLDMAFLYADPIVRQTKAAGSKMTAVDVPLDLQIEYQHILRNLKKTNKKFTIMKEAVNNESLLAVVTQNPKIIHISCHGAFDNEELQQFYLAFEQKDTGIEHKFTQEFLAQMLSGQNHEIKVAFISACYSEKIGEIFFKSGIPVVIAVNSKQPIMDDCCKMFSQQFYTNLLNGDNIGDAFNKARNIVRTSPDKELGICCCAHEHAADCAWQKFSQEELTAAHEMHCQNCPCAMTGINGNREHGGPCPAYGKFAKRMDEIKEKYKEKKAGGAAVDPSGQSNAQLGFFGGEAFDVDALEFDLEEAEADGKRVMCCCRKETPHDETMKFVLKVSDDYEKTKDKSFNRRKQIKTKIAEVAPTDLAEIMKELRPTTENKKVAYTQGTKLSVDELKQFLKRVDSDMSEEHLEELITLANIKDEKKHRKSFKEFQTTIKTNYHPILFSTLFKSNPEGKLVDLKEKESQRPHIPYILDKRRIFGRHVEIQKLVVFLTKEPEKVYVLNGPRESGSVWIAKHCIQYAMDRGHFEDGAYYVDVLSKHNTLGMLRILAAKLNLLSHEENDVIEMIDKQHLAIVIDNCQNIIERDLDNFISTLKNISTVVRDVKIILITNSRKDLPIAEPDRQDLASLLTQKMIGPLDKYYSLKMMFDLNEGGPNFGYKKEGQKEIQQFKDIKELETECPWFEQFDLYPQKIQDISLLLGTGQQTLQQIYDSQLKQMQEERQNHEDKKNFEIDTNRINEQLYQQIKAAHPVEAKILHILSFAPQGLSKYDIARIIRLLNSEECSLTQEMWDEFLRVNIFSAQNDQQPRWSGQNGGALKIIPEYIKQINQVKPENNGGAHVGMEAWRKLPRQLQTPYTRQVKSVEPGAQAAPNSAEFTIVHQEYVPEIFMKRYYLEESFRKCINGILLNDEMKIIQSSGRAGLQQYSVATNYLRYMAVCSRELVKYMQNQNQSKFPDFNPYVVNQQINAGLWEQDQILKGLCGGYKNEASSEQIQDQAIQNALSLFYMHEQNFRALLDQLAPPDQSKIAGAASDSSKFADVFQDPSDEIKIYFQELCLNIVSIYMSADRYKHAQESLDKVQQICSKYELKYLSQLLKLVEASINLKEKKRAVGDPDLRDLYEAEEYFEELTEQNEKTGTKALARRGHLGRGEVHFLVAVSKIKQLEKLMASTEDNFGNQYQIKKQMSEDELSQNCAEMIFNEASTAGQNRKNQQYQEPGIISSLQESREHFQRAGVANGGDSADEAVAIAKTWLVEAELVLEKCAARDEIKIEYEKKFGMSTLYQKLGESCEVLLEDDLKYYNMGLKCRLKQAEIAYLLTEKDFVHIHTHARNEEKGMEGADNAQYWEDAREKAVFCFNTFQDLGQMELAHQANKLFERCSQKLAITQNNFFVFAQALSIRGQSDFIYIQKQTNDFNEIVKKSLEETKMALNLKFEVLTRQFLQTYRKRGSKILHLIPMQFGIQTDGNHLLIEDDQFTQVKLTADQLKELLRSKEQNEIVNLDLVVIEAPNCPEIGQVFVELGAKHVIYFKVSADFCKDKNGSQEKEVLYQHKHNVVKQFMKEFSTNLYPLIVGIGGQKQKGAKNGKSIRDAKEAAEKAAKQKWLIDPATGENLNEYLDYGGLDVELMTSKPTDRIFSNSKADPKKRLNEGNVYDVSHERARGNFKPDTLPFVMRPKCTMFQKMIEMIMSDQSHFQGPNEHLQSSGYINFHGSSGIGKTRHVYEAASYLKYRYLFNKGVYMLDLNNIHDLKLDLDQIIKAVKSQISSLAGPEPMMLSRNNSELQNRRLSRNQSFGQDSKTNGLLLVFDNCDKFVQEKRLAFERNLQYLVKQIANITFIFISREKFDASFHYRQMEIKPLDFTQSLLFLQGIDDSDSTHPFKDLLMSRFGGEEKYASIIKSAQGNPLILELICVIFRYGGKELLSRVLIKPISEIKDEDHDGAASSSGTQHETEEPDLPKFTGQKKFTTMFFQDGAAAIGQRSRLGQTMKLQRGTTQAQFRSLRSLARKPRPDQKVSLFGEPKNKKMAATAQGPTSRESLTDGAGLNLMPGGAGGGRRLDILAEALDEESVMDVREDAQQDLSGESESFDDGSESEPSESSSDRAGGSEEPDVDEEEPEDETPLSMAQNSNPADIVRTADAPRHDANKTTNIQPTSGQGLGTISEMSETTSYKNGGRPQTAGDSEKVPATEFNGLYIKASAASGHGLKVVIVEREGSLPSMQIEGSLQQQAADAEAQSQNKLKKTVKFATPGITEAQLPKHYDAIESIILFAHIESAPKPKQSEDGTIPEEEEEDDGDDRSDDSDTD